MLEAAKVSQSARNPFAWSVVILLALLAWIPTTEHAMSMAAMNGLMIMPFMPFMLFWLFMVIAMMLPGLAPLVSVRYAAVRQSTSGILASAHSGIFALSYLFMWVLYGIPIYGVSLLFYQLAQQSASTGRIVGVVLLLAIGIYQLLPLERSCLGHCNPALGRHTETSPATLFSSVTAGVVHSVYCAGCCGALMLVMLAVGLMNMPWMIVLTVLILLEKALHWGERISFLIGIGVIAFAIVTIFVPTLIPGLYMGPMQPMHPMNPMQPTPTPMPHMNM